MSEGPDTTSAGAPADRSAHLEAMIAAVPPEKQPPVWMACRQNCDQAHWVREGETLRCLCQEGRFLTWPRLVIEDCTSWVRARDHDDKGVREYLDRMISAAPVTERPAATNICRQHCPMAMWTREGLVLRCFCHADGIRTWPESRLDDCSHWPA